MTAARNAPCPTRALRAARVLRTSSTPLRSRPKRISVRTPCLLHCLELAVARLTVPRTFAPDDDSVDGLRPEVRGGMRRAAERQREVRELDERLGGRDARVLRPAKDANRDCGRVTEWR